MDPIDGWLSTPPLTNVDDGLGWWTAMELTGHPLSRMSLNFLSAPGMWSPILIELDLIILGEIATSTDVERAFSRGGLTVSKMRHSLSDESTRAATVLSSWCEFPSAIPRDEIISTFKDKSKRPKGSGNIVLESDGDLDLTIDNWTLVCDVMLWLRNRAVFVHKLWVLVSTHGYLWVPVGSGSVLSYSWVVGTWLVDQSHSWEQTRKDPSWDIKILKTREFGSG